MKQLLFYELDNTFVTEQTSAGGDGTKVVSVYNGVAWSEDSGITYYRDNESEKVTHNITVYYKNNDLGADIIEPEIIQVKGYAGCAVNQVLYPKNFDNLIPSVSGVNLSVTSDTAYTFFYEYEDLTLVPLTFKVTSPGQICWTNHSWDFYATTFEIDVLTIQYSKNGGEWTNITSASGDAAPRFSVVTGDVVRFRGDNATYGMGYTHNTWESNIFSGTTCQFELIGNIMSLIQSSGFETLDELNKNAPTPSHGSNWTFSHLFYDCTGLTSARRLVLPATKLWEGCYSAMFYRCTNLVYGPEILSAQNLPEICYQSMFGNCTNLVKAPEILATSATGIWCLEGAFLNCSSLNYIKCMLERTSTDYLYQWVDGVGNSGTFVKNKNNSSWTTGNSGIPVGWTVIDA